MSLASVVQPVRPRSPFRRVHRLHPSYGQQQHRPSSSAASSAASSHVTAVSAASATASTTTATSASSAHSTHITPDSFYGHEDVSRICARFVSHTFSCPEVIPIPQQQQGSGASSAPGAPSGPNVPNTLAHFVAYALHRTRLHPSVTFTSLALLHRLKTRFPAARGSSGHRLFLSAFMIASKVVCDDTYSNKSWAVVGQGLFALREINQMEREMCAYLEWQLNIPGEDLKAFEAEVRRIYSRPTPPYSHVTLQLNHGVGGANAPCNNMTPVTPETIIAYTAPNPADATTMNREKFGNLEPSASRGNGYRMPSPTDDGAYSIPPSKTTAVSLANPVPKGEIYPITPPDSPSRHNSIASPVDKHRLTSDDSSSGSSSPSPVSSEESELQTPPNSAGAEPQAQASIHKRVLPSAYSAKLSKSHSHPSYASIYNFGAVAPMAQTIQVHRASIPPHSTAALEGMKQQLSSKPESNSSSVAAREYVTGTGGSGFDEESMALDEEKRHKGSYYATYHQGTDVPRVREPSRDKVSSASASAYLRDHGRERERERVDTKSERDKRFRTYTVPCVW